MNNPILDDSNVMTALRAIDPAFGELAIKMAGEVWGRGGLTNRERAFLSIAADVTNQTLNGPLQFHIDMALGNGATRAQIKEVLLHMAIYGSFPKTLQAVQATNAHFETLDKAQR